MIRDRRGAAFRSIRDKPAALIEFLPGVSPKVPTPAQAFATGAEMARMHAAADDFKHTRESDWPSGRILSVLRDHPITNGTRTLTNDSIVARARSLLNLQPGDLPAGTIHADLFPDNVLLTGGRVTGIVDFYFAHTGPLAFDLAVAHSAWSFKDGGYDPAIGRGLIEGYEAHRKLSANERDALPRLCQSACLRFFASRVEEWSSLPPARRKDPFDFLARWDFYARSGHAPFA